ncbi:MAG: SDR family oxidoreductase [Gammaproteobacteria bacterium]|nr:SDR family oxidoreductase [Gammaproteobacteria bacterium]
MSANLTSLSGKTAIITGASRGIGESAAREFASLGASVVLTARSLEAMQTVADDINDAGGKAIAVGCDVSRYEDVEQAVQSAIDHFGRLDILINNAGVIDPIARIGDSEPGQWSQVIDINVKGVYHAVRASLPHMCSQGDGTIINLSSGAATHALEGWSHYCVSKAAVLSLTTCIHKEYAEQGIRVVGLSPGTVATDMQVKIKASGINPVSQMSFDDHIDPSWPARAIAWLCTDAGKPYDGTDFSIKTDENRRLVGLID